MKKKHHFIVFWIILALIAGLFYLTQSSSVDEQSSTTIDAVKVAVAGVELAYPASYGVYEKKNSPYTKTLNTIVWYENTESNKSFFTGAANAPQEPPVTMSLDVYNNPNNISPKELLGAESAYMFARDPGTPVIVGGVQGTMFDWDGLYRGKSIMINSKGVMYVFSVTSIAPGDIILRDFDLLLGSVTFK